MARVAAVRARLAEGALLVASAMLYFRTMAPAIAVGDAGELALAAHTLGIAHPPGYPLYTALGRIASWLPLQPIATRFNLLSLACAVATLHLFLRAARSIGVSLGPRLAATALFAGSLTFWSQAAIAEVYMLHMLLLMAAVVAALDGLNVERGGKGASPRSLLFMAYAIGMAGAHHPSALLLVPLGAAVLALAWRGLGNARLATLAASVGLLALPFTIYLVLPIRSRFDPAIDWGNPETLSALLSHAARAGYGDVREFARPIGVLAAQIGAFARVLADDLTFGAALAAPAGFALLLRRSARAFIIVASLFLLFSLGTIFLVNFPITPIALYDNRIFFLPAVCAAALAVGVLFEGVLDALGALGPLARGALMRGALSLLLIGLAVAPVLSRFPRMDRHDHTVAEDLGFALLSSVEPGGTLLASEGQAVHSLAYVSGVLGYRPDVKIVDRLGVLGGGRGIGGKALPSGRARSEGLFATDPQALRARGLTAVPWGLGYRSGSESGRPTPGVWDALGFRRPDDVESIDLGERDVLVEAYLRMGRHVAWAGLKTRGEDAMRQALDIAGPDARDRYAIDFAVAYEAVGRPERAREFWSDAIRAAPAEPAAWRGAGLAAGRAGRWGEARERLETAARLAPGDAAILVDLGGACLALADSGAARAAWTEALALDPGNHEAARGVGMLGR